MSGELVLCWLVAAAATVREHRAHLTELDAAIGDGDHGINMDRGFAAIRKRLASGAIATDAGGPLLVDAGRTILGTVGGASGALYGRALMRAGTRLTDLRSNGEAAPLAEAIFEGLVAATEAIAALGRSAVGDKTMLDALVPAQAALRAATEAGRPAAEALRVAAGAAEDGALATIPLVAKKGRASYLGERSVGHLDPGAASSALLIRALAEAAGSGRNLDDHLRFGGTVSS